MIISLILMSAASRVTDVVVYPDRASVVRSQSVACDGRAAATFDDLPPAADPASFRARTSAGAVLGLRSEERTRDARFAAEADTVDAELRKVLHDAGVLDDVIDRGDGAQRLAAHYEDAALALVGREMVGAPSAKSWGAAFDAALATRLKGAAELADAASRRRKLDDRLAELRRRQRELSASAARHSYSAEVLVACAAGEHATVSLTYVVGGAGWTPAYEARADGETSVTLATYATVAQSTGEGWSGAKLTLSTAAPESDATPPTLSALRVYAEERAAPKKTLVRRDEQRQHARSSASAPAGAPFAEGFAAAAQGLSVQLAVPTPADVPGDGTPVRLYVGSAKLAATTALRTAPKLAPYAFRVADLVDTAPFPLLPGPVDAFRGGSFLGRTPLERVAQGAKFSLTFGLDERLTVKRTVVDEIQRDAGFFGGTRRFHYAYKFELANHHPDAQVLTLEEPVPVSELDDVKVELEAATTPGHVVDAQLGRVTWTVKLAPGETKTVELRFHVDAPAAYDSGS